MTNYRDELPRFTELEAEYEILKELGRGGTAVVYLARDRELGRSVAIKVIRATYIDDEEAAARLAREARTVAGLQHANIVMLYGTRRLRDRSLALIMQYVAGRTLKSEIAARGPLPFEQIDHVLTDLGCALAYAHRNRIVHRDIKPENIYLDDESGVARLSDFGIARSWDTRSNLTLPGTALGTPAYMAPEQIDGGVVDGRSDLYSLGMVGYEMLTGETPWDGESLFGIIYKQKHEELPALAERRRGVPEAMRCAIEGALHKDPERRWADASEFLAALGGLVTQPTPTRRAVQQGGASNGASTPAQVAEPIAPAKPTVEPAENATVQLRRTHWAGAKAPGAAAGFELVHPAPAGEWVPARQVTEAPAVHSAPLPQRHRGRDLLVAAITSLVLAGGIATIAMTSRPDAVGPGADAGTFSPAAAAAAPPTPATGVPGVAVRAHAVGCRAARIRERHTR